MIISLNFTTLDKDGKLTESFHIGQTLVNSDRAQLQVALGVVSPRCWPRVQHIAPDRGKVVMAPILFNESCSILMWISSLTPLGSTANILTPSMST